MTDEQEPTKPPPVTRAVPVDEGLVAWADLLHGTLVSQTGVEITRKQGASVQFKFRGQTFSVSVQRTA